MLTDIKDDLCRAMAFAAWVHSQDKDKAGVPYIWHPLTVAMACKGDRAQMILAFLHDIWEDHEECKCHPAWAMFPDYILEAMEAITKQRGEAYHIYINRVKRNELARAVKIKDLEHNMDILRLQKPELEKEDMKRLNRYLAAWRRLTDWD